MDQAALSRAARAINCSAVTPSMARPSAAAITSGHWSAGFKSAGGKSAYSTRTRRGAWGGAAPRRRGHLDHHLADGHQADASIDMPRGMTFMARRSRIATEGDQVPARRALVGGRPAR